MHSKPARLKIFLSRLPGARAFTLPELIAVFALIAILAALLIGNYDRLIAKFEITKCMGNLKGLHSVFAGYLSEHGHWPKQPEFTSAEDREYEEWWLEEMEPSGAYPGLWQCPSIVRMESHLDARFRSKIHYSPTMFDEKPFTPYRWATQPWLTEIANAHGHGALILFTDGSIRPMNDFMPE